MFATLIINGVMAQNSYNIPLKHVAYRTTEPLSIDGKGDEVSWQKAPFTNHFIDIEGKIIPKYDTQAKMLWDETYFYIYAEMEEPHVWGTLKERDTVIFYNNDFEVFIDATGDTHNYYELEVNALNTAWDLFLGKPYREHSPVLDHWDINGLKTAVHINGTLNNSADIDKGWSIEIAIPWNALEEAAGKRGVPVNDFWRVNFSRVNWDFNLDEHGRYSRKKNEEDKYLPEYNWVWSPQGVINMHEPEHWGYVYFSEETADTPVNFEIPKDEHIKWYLYELYRAQKKQQNKTGNGFKNTKSLIGKGKLILGEVIKPKLENHSLGWNLTVLSPFSGKKIIIREDGKCTIQ